jgi:UDP-glucose 6-dehydrogenase
MQYLRLKKQEFKCLSFERDDYRRELFARISNIFKPDTDEFKTEYYASYIEELNERLVHVVVTDIKEEQIAKKKYDEKAEELNASTINALDLTNLNPGLNERDSEKLNNYIGQLYSKFDLSV